jgi:hypothetical protein
MVAMPLQYADPANNCVARGMLSRDGTREMVSPWTLSDVMELVRGAYLLHTRSYQATVRPLSNTSTFGTIFAKARVLAERRMRGEIGKTSMVPHGLRSEEKGMEKRYRQLLDRLDSSPYPDPPFFPEGQGRRTMIGSRDSNASSTSMCLSFDARGGRHPYELPMAIDCALAEKRKSERAVWLWHKLAGVHAADSGPTSVVG